jgi:hypothetical protein
LINEKEEKEIQEIVEKAEGRIKETFSDFQNERVNVSPPRFINKVREKFGEELFRNMFFNEKEDNLFFKINDVNYLVFPNPVKRWRYEYDGKFYDNYSNNLDGVISRLDKVAHIRIKKGELPDKYMGDAVNMNDRTYKFDTIEQGKVNVFDPRA